MPRSSVATDWKALAGEILNGREITRDEALAVVQAPDEEVLEILGAAFLIRQKYFGRRVKLNMLLNAKSGLCPEDCGYCSQSVVSEAPIKKYGWVTREEIFEGAREAINRKAGTYCIVASGRKPTDREIDHIAEAVKELRATTRLKICCCLGLLTEKQAKKLAEAGVQRYNHNINTSRDKYTDICSTHTYDDRVGTINKSKDAGISPCSGVIFGMGESDEDAVEMAFALKALGADSIPCNFLHPVEGTPMEGRWELTPRKCLKLLAMMRFVNPSKEVRIAGGREVNLRSMQALGLYAANSIFVGDYLTTPGQQPIKDWEMIEDLGFEIEDPTP